MSCENVLPKRPDFQTVSQSAHILVVDDEPEIRQMVALCLQKSNFRVTCAEHAGKAYEYLRSEPFDAVISDVMMPGEDGIEFLGHVHEVWPELPVILMTGHAQLQMAVNAIKNGAFDFVHKPFDFDHLRKIVQRAVSFRNLQRIEKAYLSELEETVAQKTAQLRDSMAELDFARKALQQAATDKSAFMSTVSHEMRTPMNGVIGSLELLAEEDLGSSARQYVAMARQSAENMMTLIEQLISFNSLTNLQSGVVQKDLVDPAELIISLVEHFRPLFKVKGVALEYSVTETVPPQLWTDREKLVRLLEILLGNAHKFTAHGSVLIELGRSLSPETGDQLVCAFSDTGCGIPDGMLEKIFEPFVQGDSSFSRSYEGVGLGLAIARQNALLLNGQVWAEHVPSGGSKFVVTIPVNTP